MPTMRTWTGATNGTLATATNWLADTAPGAGEGALMPGSVQNPPDATMDGITAALALVVVTADAKYPIGVSGDPMKLDCNEWKHYGSGKLWMDVDAISDGCDILIDCQPGGNADIAGAFTNAMTVRVIRGGTPENPVDIAATFGAMTNLFVRYRSNRDTDSYVNIASGAGALAMLDQEGGQVISGNNITDAIIAGGLHRTTSSGTMGTARVKRGGRLQYRSTGTMTLADIAGAIQFLKGKTQTATDMTLWPGSTASYDEDLLTITNGLRDLRKT